MLDNSSYLCRVVVTRLVDFFSITLHFITRCPPIIINIAFAITVVIFVNNNNNEERNNSMGTQNYFKYFIPWEKPLPLSSFHRSYGEGHISLAQRKTTTRKPYSQKFCYVLRNVQISDERESHLKTSPRARTLCFVVATPLSYSLLI